VFVASHHQDVGDKSGWLTIRRMCPSKGHVYPSCVALES